MFAAAVKWVTSGAVRRAGLAAAVAVVATIAMIGVAPGRASASGPTPGAVIGVAAGTARPATTAAGAQACFGTSYPDCTSSDPDVTFHSVSEGDTTGCVFQDDITWGDGSSTTQNFDGGPDGTQLATFEHTYTAGPNTYTIDVTGETTSGDCSSDGATLEFTLSSGLSVDAGADQTVLGTNVISLAGTVGGTYTDLAWTQVSGPGTTTFKSANSLATQATVSALGTYTFELTASDGAGDSGSDTVAVSVQAYVALGDSYSAGDGAVTHPSLATGGSYLPGGSSLIPSSSGDAGCLQSVHAYPELVDTYVSKTNPVPAGTANPAFTFDACTAAEIGDITSHSQLAGKQSVPPQISALEEEPAASVGLITLTIGGNDAGFGDVMAYCGRRLIFEQSCEDHSAAEVERSIDGGPGVPSLAARLQALYTRIKDVTNIDGKSPLATGARIVVLGYPKFFPTGQASACSTGYLTRDFQPSDMAWIDNVIYRVDTTIQTAATAAGVTYADTYNAFDGNELCQESPSLNDLTIGPLLSYDLDVKVGIQSFHPTIAGQAALAPFAEGKGVIEGPATPSFTSTPSTKILVRGVALPVTVDPYFTFTATGNPPPTFTVSSGSLPAGLILDPVSGLISGTPKREGIYTFRVTASNSAGNATSVTVRFLVL